MIEKLFFMMMMMTKVVLENGDIYDPPLALVLENLATKILQVIQFSQIARLPRMMPIPDLVLRFEN